MQTLNINFMELYKDVDRFIKDAYSTQEGISEYIREMEIRALAGKRSIPTWDTDYAALKHLRYIRNQLAHDVSYDSDICEEADYDYLEGFRDRLFSGTDPLARLTKSESVSPPHRTPSRSTTVHNRLNPPREPRGILQRIKGFFGI